MSTHKLSANRKNLHGTYFRDNRPVLIVKDGDTVVFETLEVGWRTERVLAGKALAEVENQHPVLDNGPALTGPVYVEGAMPGMVLEVKFVRFQPGCWAWTSAGGSSLCIPELSGVSEKASVFWDVDLEADVAISQWGHRVELAPFLGCVGVASSDERREPGWFPHPRTGGNLDANVLTKGSSLFLPVEVEGGLLSVGDAHASQGHGELAGRGLECPMEEAELSLHLHQDMAIKGPVAFHDDLWTTFGIAETLDQAAVLATNRMLDLITANVELSRSEALALCTAYVDLHITQMVNPRKTVQATLRVPLEQLRPRR